MTDNRLIRVLDFESTHSSPVEGGLVEIGYADLKAKASDLLGNPTDWEVVGGKSRLCNQLCPIPPETEAVHHIGDEDVRALPSWKALLRGLLQCGPRDGVIA